MVRVRIRVRVTRYILYLLNTDAINYTMNEDLKFMYVCMYANLLLCVYLGKGTIECRREWEDERGQEAAG
jgi:hypothetical protein